MARNMYGATSADFTLTSGGRVVPGATLTIWSARTGGTQITDLLDVDSVAATTVTSDADGSIVYYGPNNDKTVHWADSGQGSRIAIRPVDITGDRVLDGTISDIDIAADADIGRTKIAGTALTTTSTGVFSVLDYGAVGDNSHDDTAAIAAAIAAAAAANGQVFFPPVAVGYKTTAPTLVPSNIDVIMESRIVYHGAANTTALSINPTDPYATRRTYKLAVFSSAQSDWTNETSIGIICRNLDRCTVTIMEATRFTIGVEFLGANGGCAYNTVTLVDIYCNKVGVDLNTTGTGWANENLFFGGAFSVESATHLGLTRYGIRVRSEAAYLNNSNIFHKPCFEIGDGLTGGAEAVPILVSSGMYNAFRDVRFESSSTSCIIRTTGTSQHNYVSTGHTPGGSLDILCNLQDDQGSAPSSVVEPAIIRAVSSCTRLVADFPALHQKAVPWDADDINLPGLMFAYANQSTMYNHIPTVTIGAEYLETAWRGIGVYVDTRRAKRFVVERDVEAGYGGRVIIRCYDASHVVLDPASYTGVHGAADAPLIVGLSPTPDWGKAYVTGSDSDEPLRFVVANDVVDHVCIMVGPGSAALRISALRIFTDVPFAPNVWTDFPENAVLPMAVQAPASGTWNAGQTVMHGAPSSGNPMGWVCTVAGTPGTWKALANVVA